MSSSSACVVITGAAGGIGRAICMELVRLNKGYKLALWDRDQVRRGHFGKHEVWSCIGMVAKNIKAYTKALVLLNSVYRGPSGVHALPLGVAGRTY